MFRSSHIPFHLLVFGILVTLVAWFSFHFFPSCPSYLAKCKQRLRNIFVTSLPKVTINQKQKWDERNIWHFCKAFLTHWTLGLNILFKNRLDFWIILSKISIVSSWTKCAWSERMQFFRGHRRKSRSQKGRKLFCYYIQLLAALKGL